MRPRPSPTAAGRRTLRVVRIPAKQSAVLCTFQRVTSGSICLTTAMRKQEVWLVLPTKLEGASAHASGATKMLDRAPIAVQSIPERSLPWSGHIPECPQFVPHVARFCDKPAANDRMICLVPMKDRVLLFPMSARDSFIIQNPHTRPPVKTPNDSMIFQWKPWRPYWRDTAISRANSAGVQCFL